jgi:putative component of membrane protein insertase Oxa1/YidC/SpoIIIJ protein YidD
MKTAIIPAVQPTVQPANNRDKPGADRFLSLKNSQDQASFPAKGHRLVTLPDGSPALDTNGLSYQDYIKHIMPQLKLSPAQQWGTWMIRRLYQGTTRNTIYKWFGNPCLYKKHGNLSCSEYTLIMLQTCGMPRGIANGWQRISSEGPNPLTHPKLFLATWPFIGKRIRASMPSANTPPLDKPIPLNWFKNPAVITKLASL